MRCFLHTVPRKVTGHLPNWQTVHSEYHEPPITGKGGQWAETRGQSRKHFQDQRDSSLFWLELTLPLRAPLPSHLGSHTTLQLWRENKAGSQSTKTSFPLQGSSWPGGLGGCGAPLGSQGLSEPLCGAPRGRCSGPRPQESGKKGARRDSPSHQQECLSLSDGPQGHILWPANIRDFPTDQQQLTRPSLSSQGGASASLF